jgi:hypothetical protein
VAFGYFTQAGFRGLDGVIPWTGGDLLPLGQSFYFDEVYSAFTQPVSTADQHTGPTGLLLSPASTLAAYSGACADLTPDSECETSGFTFGDPLITGGAPGAITVQVFQPLNL